MELNRNRPLYVALILLGTALLISVTWMLVENHGRAERVLFFPGHIDVELRGEARVVPRHRELEPDVAVLVNEILLGPVDLAKSRILPMEAEVRSLMVRDRTVYLDFAPNILFLQERLGISLDEAFDAVRRTVLYNFRGIRRVVITVNGQLPNQPHFEVKNTLTNKLASI